MAEGDLRREIKKRGPFESPEEEALLNLLRTHDQMQLRFARFFREHGLTPSQYNVLRILRGEGKPLPSLEIAGRLLTIAPGTTGLIDRLEKLGLVARHRCDSDRRVVFVAITDRGTQLVDAMDQPIRVLQRRLIGHLSAAELMTLSHLLEKARRNDGGEETDPA